MKFRTLNADTWRLLLARAFTRARAGDRPSDALVRHLRDRGVRGRPGGWMYRDAWLDAAGRPRGAWQPVCQGWLELLRRLCVEEGTSELEDELRWSRDALRIWGGSPVMPRFVPLPERGEVGVGADHYDEVVDATEQVRGVL